MMGTCQLCETQGELLPAQIVSPPFHGSLGGLIDNRPSMCEACIDGLGEWDDYAAHTLLAGRPPAQRGKEAGELPFVHFEQVDSTLIRLFALSVLWRASVSSLPSLQHVRLGPFQDWLRDLLKAGNPGAPRDFPITMWIEISPEIRGAFYPASATIDGRRLWSFWVADLGFTVATDRRLAEDDPHILGAQPLMSGLIAPVMSAMGRPEFEAWLRAAIEAAKAS